jgi:tetratricopeptide (TPR) repeat protein
MNRGLLTAILSLLLTMAVYSSTSALELDSAYLADIRNGINLTINERFVEARNLFQMMANRDSTDYAPLLFLAGVEHAEMFDREDYSARPKFDSLISKALTLTEKAIRENRNSAWAHLTRGNAYAYIATLETKVGSWWGALRKGLAAKNEYLEALELDPLLYDAYLGLGSYHYWKSAKTEFINWLPLIADRKEEGLAELQLAIDSSLFSTDMAANSLLWIYLDWGRADDAYDVACRLQEKFPDSRLFNWGVAFAAYSSRRLPEALAAFGRILTMIEEQPGQNNFNTIECRFHRAVIFNRLGQKDNAMIELQKLLSYPVSDEVRKRQGDKIAEAREMLKKLQR